MNKKTNLEEDNMENKINLAELLKNCPKGMELDCTVFNNVVLDEINFDKDPDYPIRIVTKSGTMLYLTKYGTYVEDIDAKCVIFPKGKTTWEGFVPPVDFKDGDIVAVTMKPEGIWIGIGIFKQHKETSFESHCCLNTIGEFNSKGLKNHSFIGLRFATEEEKQKLFDAIKANGYRWNSETNTLEKLPKFKVGNRITNGKTCITIGYIDDEYYYEVGRNIANRLFIKNQDEWNLVPNKFDITTLKPFESRVLVRDTDHYEWEGAVFGRYDGNTFFTIGGIDWKYCIPYEGNEHLYGTTNDCDNFFKTWEK